MRLDYAPPLVRLTVRDTGGDAAPAADGVAGGFGLLGLRERVDLVGGEFESGPTPAGGYRVRAELPVAATGTLHGEPQPDGDEQAWVSFD